MPRILIVGAGIAGDTLAVLLDDAGWEVTVVDISPGLRSGGQIVDLRNGSAEVLHRMGLTDVVDEALIPQAGIAWVDPRGHRLAEMRSDAFGGRGFVSDRELARTDLARLIHAAGSPRIRYIWGDTVAEIVDRDDRVEVVTRNGIRESFDVVVGADGVHSAVRALTFRDETRFRRPLGIAHAWFTLDENVDTPDLAGWFLVHNAPGSRVVGARPGPHSTQEVGFSLPDEGLPDRRAGTDRRDFLAQRFTDVGWRAPELLAAAGTAPDFAMDTSDQIAMPSYGRGRVVLLGDSAWCSSPLSGLGTALALQGAEALATTLLAARPGDDRWRDYEQTMRPVVRRAQRLPPGRVRTFAPRTALGIRAVALLTRVLTLRVADGVLARIAETSGGTPRR